MMGIAVPLPWNMRNRLYIRMSSRFDVWNTRRSAPHQELLPSASGRKDWQDGSIPCGWCRGIVLPRNRPEALRGDGQGSYGIRINDRRRPCFRFVDGDDYDAEIGDHH